MNFQFGTLAMLIRWMLAIREWVSMRVFRWRLRSMGEGAKISRRAVLYRASRICIGKNSVLNDFVHIWGGGGVSIGDNTLIAAHCSITSVTHDSNALSKGLLYRETRVEAPVTIGSNVWIGSNAVVLPGVTIGDNAIVGAGAVVTGDVSPGTIVVGVPARKLSAV